MKCKLVASSLVAVGLLALAGLTSSAAAFASAAPAAEISETWYFAYGAMYDGQALKELPPGSFYTGPSIQPRLAWRVDAPAVVYVLTDDLKGQGTRANRSEERRSQMGWLLPAPQSCFRVVSTRSGGGSKE